MTRFHPVTETTAAESVRPILKANQRKFGFVPSPVARAAASPALLKHLLAGFGAFEHSSLDAVEREVVALTVAFEVGCHYCMAMHSALLAAEQPELVTALRSGAPLTNPRLQALAELVRALIARRGQLSEDVWQRFMANGYTQAHALDALLGTGVYLLSTLSNVLTDAPLDAAFEAFRWSPPDTALSAASQLAPAP